MQKSNDLQTGGLLLLVSILICAFLTVVVSLPVVGHHLSLSALAAAIDVPTASESQVDSGSAQITVSLDDPRVTEFFPSLAEAQQELQRAERMTGPAVNRGSIRTVAGSAAPVSVAVDSATASAPTRVTVAPLENSTGPHAAAVAWTPTAMVDAQSSQPRAAAPAGAVAQHPVQHPAVSPDRVPAGSVYAPITVHPVTVNIDRETLSGQLDEMSQRLEQRFEQQRLQLQRERDALAAAELATQQKLIIAQLQRLRDQQSEQHLPSATAADHAQITRIEASLDRLMNSFHSLQTETKSNLQQISDKADRVEVANQVIESYDRALRAQLERLQQFDAPTSAARVALHPAGGPSGKQHAHTDTVPTPFAESTVDETPAADTAETQVHEHATRHFVPLNSPGPQPDEQPAPKFESLPDESAEDQPASPETKEQDRGQRSSVEKLPEPVTAPLVILPPPAAPRMLKQSVPLLQLSDAGKTQPKSAAADERMPQAVDDLPSIDLEAMIREESETPKKAAVAARSPLNVLPPAEQPPKTSKQIVVQQPAPPVGYEQVYRFQLETVETDAVDGSRPNRECPICGRVHGPSTGGKSGSGSGCETEVVNTQRTHNSRVQQVANRTTTTAVTAAPSSSAVRFPTVPPPAEPRGPGEAAASARQVSSENKAPERSPAVRRTTTAHHSPMGHGLNATPESSRRPQRPHSRSDEESYEESPGFMDRLGAGFKRLTGQQ